MNKMFSIIVLVLFSINAYAGYTDPQVDYATSAKQDTGNASLSSIDGKVATAANQATANSSLSDISGKLDTTNGHLVDLKGYADQVEGFVDGIEALLTSSNSSLTSIDGKVSTSAKQDTGNASLASIDGKVATEATLSALDGKYYSSAATLSAVASSVTSVSLLSSNASRKGLILFNDSNSVCYVAFAGTASSTAFTVKMAAGAFYEMPIPVYRGAVSAIWSNANGNMRITEL